MIKSNDYGQSTDTNNNDVFEEEEEWRNMTDYQKEAYKNTILFHRFFFGIKEFLKVER